LPLIIDGFGRDEFYRIVRATFVDDGLLVIGPGPPKSDFGIQSDVELRRHQSFADV
jgi:hypothetical protein